MQELDHHHVPRRGLRARIRYWFDSGLSRGPGVVIGWLVLLTTHASVFLIVSSP